MKQIDWTKWSAIAEILSAVAIVVTLVYLALQTQHLAEQTEQNNLLLRAEAQSDLLQNRNTWLYKVISDPGFAELVAQWGSDEDLDLIERIRLEAQMELILVNWNSEYMQYDVGILKYSDLPIEGWQRVIQILRNTTGFDSVWQYSMGTLDPGFVELIESL